MSGEVLFVGLDNPQSSDPRYALFPRPSGCTGHRLLKMMKEVNKEFTERQYINIPKTNLFPAGRLPSRNKKGFLVMAATSLVISLEGTGKNVVLMGNVVRDAIYSVPEHESDMSSPMKFVEIFGANYAWIPHPSGRNHYYNDTRKRRRVGRWLMTTLH